MLDNHVQELARALRRAPDDAPDVLLAGLLELQEQVEYPALGICGHIEGWLVDSAMHGALNPDDLPDYEYFWEDTREILFTEWPEFSGSAVYPVSTGSDEPDVQYGRLSDLEALWSGEYGDARRRLLQYLIDEYRAMLNPNHAARYNHNQASEV